MLVDDLGAKDNIILSAGSNHQAAVFLENENTRDSLQYSWQIVKEDWLSWGRTWNHFKKPAIEAGLITGSCQDHISFKAPASNGPYRIFVTVYHPNGYCATANTPIYVEDK